MKFSIVTPSYNQGLFLRHTIESVLSQGWRDLEYFVVEGGSIDDSPTISREYAAKGAIILLEYPGSSQAQAINLGLSKASGDVLSWLNSDDIYLDHALERVSHFLEQNSETDIAYGHELSINASGEVIGARLTAPGLDLETSMWHGISLPQPAVFFRRAVYDRIGGLSEDFDFSLDADYWYKAIQEFRFGHLPQVLAATRHHEKAKTGISGGGGPFGGNRTKFCDESARTFLSHGGTKFSPFYLQNRVNRHCANRKLHWLLSQCIRIVSALSTRNPRRKPRGTG